MRFGGRCRAEAVHRHAAGMQLAGRMHGLRVEVGGVRAVTHLYVGPVNGVGVHHKLVGVLVPAAVQAVQHKVSRRYSTRATCVRRRAIEPVERGVAQLGVMMEGSRRGGLVASFGIAGGEWTGQSQRYANE
jgi:hypothetical protein